MLFSIIIPTYNRGHLLEKTVSTVLNQNYKDFELIIVDDGSTDNTQSIVKQLIQNNTSKISYIHQPNSERAVARNKGLSAATGKYVSFFDSDDTLYANHLEVASGYIHQNGEPEFIHLRYDLKNEEGDVIRQGPAFDSSPNKELINGNFLSCNGIFIRRDVAVENPFNEDRKLSAMEDWELWLRLAAQYPLHYINTVTSSVIDHSERSVVTTQKKALIDRVMLLISYASANKTVTDYYGKKLHKFRSSCYSYISLHLALTGKNKTATLKYLAISFFTFPGALFQRRFYAILKHLF